MGVFKERDKATIAKILSRGGRQELLTLIDIIVDGEKYCAMCDEFYHIDEFKNKKGVFNSYDYCYQCRCDYGKRYSEAEVLRQKCKAKNEY